MVGITEIAAQKVKEVMVSQNKDNSYLRLYVAGFGWGGPNFGMTLDESKNESDILDEGFGVTILTEDKLASYLEGAVVDYVESANGGGFEIKTNNESGCGSGCGGSCGS